MQISRRLLVTIILTAAAMSVFGNIVSDQVVAVAPKVAHNLALPNFNPDQVVNEITTTTNSGVDPSIALNPTSGSPGLTVDVSGSGFSTEDTSCSLAGGSIASQTCSVSQTYSVSGATLTAAFTVLNVPGGTYTVTATGTQAGDSASASFTVNAVPPSITLNPSSAQGGATVQVSGSTFLASDTACSLSGSPVTEYTCSISSGILTATFSVASITPGDYTITASGSPGGDFASASFTVNGAPPSITLSSTSAPVGASVDVEGSGFSTADTSCSLSGTPVGTSSCSISSGTLFASFVVASVSGTYAITATGSPSDDSASATFVVSSGTISVAFNPASAQAGSNVQVSGSGFSSSDTSCNLSGSPVASQTCSISAGTLTGSFVVANVAFGSYTVTATGSPYGDSGSATFTVTSNALTITLNPVSASFGSTVQVYGSGFSSSDLTCSLSDGGSIDSETCSIIAGSITASFIVANVAAGSYTITVTGSPVGDSASAVLTVTGSSLSIALNPTFGPAGATVQVSGSGFPSSDSSCSLSGSVVSSPSCSISSGTLSGSFTVTNVTVGSYTVTAIGSPSLDSVSADFTVDASSTQTTSSTSSTTMTNTTSDSTTMTSQSSITTAAQPTVMVITSVVTTVVNPPTTTTLGPSSSISVTGPMILPPIPGFPLESIITGIILGLTLLVIVRRRERNSMKES